MLASYNSQPVSGRLATIAGGAAGKRILCTPQALPIYNELVKLARKGNYWALLVVKGIEGLTTGRLEKDNIYIQQASNLAYGKGVFYIVLPGVTATIEDRANGTFLLSSIKADINYLQLQRDKQKPGLWRVDNEVGARPEFRADGQIMNEKDRPVVIGDRALDDPYFVAAATRKDLIKTDPSVKKMVRRSGFDLHHTPGDKSGIVGLKKAKNVLATNRDRAVVESATLLANTMYNARHIEGVLWFSDWGGSAVLTRALQILKQEKNIKLDKHSVFLNRPTSNSSEALKLAEDLDMTIHGEGKKTGLRASEIWGNHLHANVSAKTAWNTGGFGVAAASAVTGFTGFVPTAVGYLGMAGALHFIPKAVTKATQAFKGKEYK